MDKFTRKTSFEQWFSPINRPLFDDLSENTSIKSLYQEALYGFIYETAFVCPTP